MNKEYLFKWIQNAYAMEREVETVLNSFEKDAENVPELQGLIREHKEQTASQAERLKDILEAHEESVPTAKAGLSQAMGFLMGQSTEFAGDQLIKNWVTMHTTEHFEMATYKVILEGCRVLEEADIATICENILAEEEEAAKKIDMMMPRLVETFLMATQQGE